MNLKNLAIVLLLAFSSAYAVDYQDVIIFRGIDGNLTESSQRSLIVLRQEARQQNRPMSEALPEATVRIKNWGDRYGFEMDMDEAEEAAADMVMAAYYETISPVDRYKQIATTEFENAVFKECYEESTSDSEE